MSFACDIRDQCTGRRLYKVIGEVLSVLQPPKEIPDGDSRLQGLLTISQRDISALTLPGPIIFV